jgi:hypothetical protein
VRWHQHLWRHLPITLLLVGLAVLYRILQERGHNWGDDFALYINQARGLVRGDVGRVVADTRYALDHSGVSTFSPNVYPWGFPLMLAPLYLLGGRDYQLFKLLEIASLCGFLLCFHLLLVRRVSRLVALVMVLVIAMSVPYAFWTNSVTADLPALCFVGITLVSLDRCRDRELFESDGRALVVLGLLIGWSFMIRRETIGLVLALAVLQALHVRRRWRSGGRTVTALRELRWDRLRLPYVVATSFVIALHLILPSSLTFDKQPGGGLEALEPNAKWYRNELADQLGLTDGGADPLGLFGSELVAKVALALFVGLCVIGIIGRVASLGGRDLHVAVYLVVTALIVGTQPFHEGRYLFSITPLMLYFAYQGIPVLVGAVDRLRRRARSQRRSRLVQVGTYASLALMLPLVVSNADDFAHAVDYHWENDYVLDGPETASSREMLAAVRRCTRGDDVVLFARARAMNLYTGRRSIQTGGAEEGVQRADWLALTNNNENYSEPPINRANAASFGLERVWHNTEYSLYRVGIDDSLHAACPAEES